MANFLILSFCVLVTVFSPFVNCENATVSVDDNEMGMGILYDMVNIFVGDVVHTKQILGSFLNFSKIFVDGEFQEDEVPDDWKEWADHLIGFAVCVAVGILYIIIMPIAGLIFCCCRCCGHCGGKRKSRESKRAKCKRRSYCTVLLILNTIALAGIVCAFLCNNLIYKHLQNENNEGTLGNIKLSIQTVERYIDHSVQEASSYVTDTFDSVSHQILQDVNDTGVSAVAEVLEQLNASALLNEAQVISAEANKTADELQEVGYLLSNLSVETDELTNNLTRIKNVIMTVCDSSSTNTACSTFKESDYKTDANFSSLDQLSDEAQKVAKAMDLYRYVQEANQTLQNATNKARDQVKDQTDEAAKAIDDVKKEIQKGIDDLKSEKNDALRDFPEAYRHLDEADDDVKKYSEYVYYGGIGVCCAYLLIVVLYYIGILYGLCGERPGHDAPCCNTGCGANFLLSGVAFTFIFAWILMIICVVMFAVGGPVYAEGCRYFADHNPDQFKIFDDALINGLNIKSIYENPPPDLSVVNMIKDCQKNKAIFSALHLDSIVDLDDIMNIQALDTKLQELKNVSLRIPDIEIISDDFKKELDDYANAGLESVNFTKYFEELSKGLTVADLSALAAGVQLIADQESDIDKKAKLVQSATDLQELDNQTLPSLRQKVSDLNDTMTSLQKQSKLKDLILHLITDLEKAQHDFNNEKDTLIENKVKGLADKILRFTNDSVNDVKHAIREQLFGCQDLSTALYAMSDSVCIMVVNPVNGLWFSFGWCLFFFVPCLIFAVLLAGQYRIEHEYDKEFDDPNYLMYGGPNPDTIPLTRLEQQAPNSSSNQRQAHPYGMSNAGYREDSKRPNSYAAPPPYEDHMHPGIAAYAPAQHQYHDLARSYPALHGDGHMAGSGSKNSYAYPY